MSAVLHSIQCLRFKQYLIRFVFETAISEMCLMSEQIKNLKKVNKSVGSQHFFVIFAFVTTVSEIVVTKIEIKKKDLSRRNMKGTIRSLFSRHISLFIEWLQL